MLKQKFKTAKEIIDKIYPDMQRALNLQNEANSLPTSFKYSYKRLWLLLIVYPLSYMIGALLFGWIANFASTLAYYLIQTVSGIISMGFIAYVVYTRKVLCPQEQRKLEDQADQYALKFAENQAKNWDDLKIIPKEFQYPEAVSYMCNLVLEDRAETRNEALNMYEEYFHRLKMENMQNKLLQEQQAQTALLKKIKSDTRYLKAMDMIDRIMP